jgi:hypothetical protein
MFLEILANKGHELLLSMNNNTIIVIKGMIKQMPQRVRQPITLLKSILKIFIQNLLLKKDIESIQDLLALTKVCRVSNLIIREILPII